jgi:hypothetical protein
MLEQLVDEGYILMLYNDITLCSGPESLTELLWWNEEGSGNEFELDEKQYSQIVQPYVEFIWKKNNLKVKE